MKFGRLKNLMIRSIREHRGIDLESIYLSDSKLAKLIEYLWIEHDIPTQKFIEPKTEILQELRASLHPGFNLRITRQTNALPVYNIYAD